LATSDCSFPSPPSLDDDGRGRFCFFFFFFFFFFLGQVSGGFLTVKGFFFLVLGGESKFSNTPAFREGWAEVRENHVLPPPTYHRDKSFSPYLLMAARSVSYRFDHSLIFFPPTFSKTQRHCHTTRVPSPLGAGRFFFPPVRILPGFFFRFFLIFFLVAWGKPQPPLRRLSLPCQSP